MLRKVFAPTGVFSYTAKSLNTVGETLVKLKIRLYLMLQRMLPHHLLSRFTGWLANRKTPWLRRTLISFCMAAYRIDLREAKRQNPDDYVDLNDFFARSLRPDARPIAEGDGCVVSPADGRVYTFAQLTADTFIQAKGHQFSLSALLADDALARQFHDGHYASVYLAPHNYHRVHMPCAGVLRDMIHVPGDLFSVSPTTLAHMPVLARNERVISVFESAHGPVAVIMVGAMNVGSIHTTWGGLIEGRKQQRWSYQPDQVALAAGDEMGQFRFGGSMVLVLYGGQGFAWQPQLTAMQTIQMGQQMGAFVSATTAQTSTQAINDHQTQVTEE